MRDADDWIRTLGLTKHPEGGYYRETYRSEEAIAEAHLPARFDGDRVFSTSLYFLLRDGQFSAFHRLTQDEVWHFYDGSPLTIHVIDAAGDYRRIKLGRSPEGNQQLQVVVKAGWLFGATVDEPDSYSLVGCTVAPGFEFRDLAMPARRELVEQYPEHREIIERLTREE